MLSVAQTKVFCVIFCLPLLVFLFFFFLVIELFYPSIVGARVNLLVLLNFSVLLQHLYDLMMIVGVLTPLSAIFQLYYGDQF